VGSIQSTPRTARDMSSQTAVYVGVHDDADRCVCRGIRNEEWPGRLSRLGTSCNARDTIRLEALITLRLEALITGWDEFLATMKGVAKELEDKFTFAYFDGKRWQVNLNPTPNTLNLNNLVLVFREWSPEARPCLGRLTWNVDSLNPKPLGFRAEPVD